MTVRPPHIHRSPVTGGLGAAERQPCDFAERHDGVDRAAEVQRDRQVRHGEPDEYRDDVPDKNGQKLALLAVRFLAIRVRHVEVLAPRVGVQGGSQDAGVRRAWRYPSTRRIGSVTVSGQ